MTTRIKIILWAFPILAVVLEILIYQAFAIGLTIPWKFVGKPSENISQIIGFNPGKLFVATDSLEMYSLATGNPLGGSDLSHARWSKDNLYKKELDPINSSGYGGIEFTSSPPPFEIKQIYQFSFPAVESINLTKFALSQDGNLWFWSHTNSWGQGLLFSLLLVIEILVYGLALFINLAIFLTKRITSKIRP